MVRPNKNDWVGLFRVGAPATFNPLEWCYLSGTQKEPPSGKTAADFPFALPKHLSAGQYEFPFYATDQFFKLLATGDPFTVGSGGFGTPSITAAPTQAGSE